MRSCIIAGTIVHDLTVDEAAQRIGEFLIDGRRTSVVTPNAAHIVLLQSQPEFRAAYANAGLVLADGMAVVVALRVLGCTIRERCSGSDLFPRLLQLGGNLGKKVFLLGGTNGSEKAAAARARAEYGVEIMTYSPPMGFDGDPGECRRIVELVNESGAKLLCVHVGAPKSEIWIHRHLQDLEVSVACSLGMALEYYAGTKRRAPARMQGLGLEWMFRLFQEPRRLWRRYTLGSVAFLSLVAREAIRRRVWDRAADR